MNPHSKSIRTIMAATALTASAGVASSFATAGASASSRLPFSGKVCQLVPLSALAAAHIKGRCIPLQGSSASISGAHWGTAGSGHYLTVFIAKEPAMLAGVLRARVLKHGARVKVGTVASVHTDTYNGGHKQGDLLFLAGDYLGHVALNDDNPSTSLAGIAGALVQISTPVAAPLK